MRIPNIPCATVHSPVDPVEAFRLKAARAERDVLVTHTFGNPAGLDLEFKRSSDPGTRTLFMNGRFVAWCQPWLTPRIEEFLTEDRTRMVTLTFGGRRLGNAPFQIDSIEARFTDAAEVQRIASGLATQVVGDTLRIGSTELPIR